MDNQIQQLVSEKKNKHLAIKITVSEQQAIEKYCAENFMNKTDLVRYALQSILPSF